MRRILLLGVALLVVVVLVPFCALVVFSPPSPSQFTEEQRKRIEMGMTEADVNAIMGCSAGWHASPDTMYLGSGPMIWWTAPEGCHLPDTPDETIKAWIGDEGMVLLTFDKAGRVIEAAWGPVWSSKRYTPTFQERVRLLLARYSPFK